MSKSIKSGFSLLKDNALYARPDDYVSTGNLLLNWAIANGSGRGVPRGKSVELYGDPSTGKSLIAYQIIAQTQALGGEVFLDDVECALTPSWARKLGVDTDNLHVRNSRSIEDCAEAIIAGIADGVACGDELRTFVVDSFGNISCRHEIDVGMGKRDMERAYQIRKLFRFVTPELAEAGYILIALNHQTANIGNMFQPKTTTGGSGAKYNASVRIGLSHAGRIPKEKNKQKIGVNLKYYIEKNRVAPPYRFGEFSLMFDKGIPQYSGILEKLMDLGILEYSKSKAYVEFAEDEDDVKYPRKTFNSEFNNIAVDRGFDDAVEFLDTLLATDEENTTDSTEEEEEEGEED